MSDLLKEIDSAIVALAYDAPGHQASIVLSRAKGDIVGLQAVLDAARPVYERHSVFDARDRVNCQCALCAAFRALGGAPTGDSVPLSDTDCQMYRSTVQQPSDSGTDNVTPPADLLRGSDADGE